MKFQLLKKNIKKMQLKKKNSKKQKRMNFFKSIKEKQIEQEKNL